jgi:signal transduction histidine kinase
VRHSGASRCWLRLERLSDGYQLEVSDDGCGSSAVRPNGGLTSIGERAAAVGGELSVEGGPSGFRLRLRIPAGPAR